MRIDRRPWDLGTTRLIAFFPVSAAGFGGFGTQNRPAFGTSAAPLTGMFGAQQTAATNTGFGGFGATSTRLACLSQRSPISDARTLPFQLLRNLPPARVSLELNRGALARQRRQLPLVNLQRPDSEPLEQQPLLSVNPRRPHRLLAHLPLRALEPDLLERTKRTKRRTSEQETLLISPIRSAIRLLREALRTLFNRFRPCRTTGTGLLRFVHRGFASGPLGFLLTYFLVMLGF